MEDLVWDPPCDGRTLVRPVQVAVGCTRGVTHLGAEQSCNLRFGRVLEGEDLAAHRRNKKRARGRVGWGGNQGAEHCEHSDHHTDTVMMDRLLPPSPSLPSSIFLTHPPTHDQATSSNRCPLRRTRRPAHGTGSSPWTCREEATQRVTKSVSVSVCVRNIKSVDQIRPTKEDGADCKKERLGPREDGRQDGNCTRVWVQSRPASP